MCKFIICIIIKQINSRKMPCHHILLSENGFLTNTNTNKFFNTCVLCGKTKTEIDLEIVKYNYIRIKTPSQYKTEEYYKTPLNHCCKYDIYTGLCKTELTYVTNNKTKENYKYAHIINNPLRLIKIQKRCQCHRIFTFYECKMIGKFINKINKTPSFDTIEEENTYEIEKKIEKIENSNTNKSSNT